MGSLTLVSWNLFGLEPHQLDVRTEAACFGLLMEDPPDIVCFQEVIDRCLHAHLKPHFSNAGYGHIVQPATTEYYCTIFVKHPLKLINAGIHPFPSSQMGRALLEARIDWDGVDLLVLTSHLESLREGRRARQEQLALIVERLGQHRGPAVFAGDTNLRDPEVGALPGIVDAWEAVGGRGHRFTWRPWKGKAKARFDRVYLNDQWVCEDFTLGEGEPVPEAGVPISDHRMVRVRLTSPNPEFIA